MVRGDLITVNGNVSVRRKEDELGGELIRCGYLGADLAMINQAGRDNALSRVQSRPFITSQGRTCRALSKISPNSIVIDLYCRKRSDYPCPF